MGPSSGLDQDAGPTVKVPWVLWLLPVAGSLLYLLVLRGGPPVPSRVDFEIYRLGGQLFLDGGYLYGELPATTTGHRLPFTYPPIAAVLFSVFALIPVKPASLLFTGISLACVCWLARLFVQHFGPAAETAWPRGRALACLACLCFGLVFGPVRETLLYGQINLILAVLILLDISPAQRRWWTGTFVGLTMAIKLTPAVFFLYFFLRKDWRSMAVTVLSFAGCTILGHVAMPTASKAYWTEILRDNTRIGGFSYTANQSLNGVLARFGLAGDELSVAWLIAALLAGGLITWVSWRLLRLGHRFAAGIVVGFAALLCSPIAWDHHWVWAWPLLTLIALWAWADSPRRIRWLSLAGSGAVAFILTPHWLVPREDEATLHWAWYQHLIGNSFTIWALTALVLIGAGAPKSKANSDWQATSTDPA